MTHLVRPRWNRCELRPGGAELDVTASELHLWVEEVTRMLLVDSIIEQVGQLVKGEHTRHTSKLIELYVYLLCFIDRSTYFLYKELKIFK